MKKFLLILLALSFQLFGMEIIVNTYEGESYLFDVDPNESIADLQHHLIACSPCTGFFIELPECDYLAIASRLKRSKKQGGYLGYPRNYYCELTDQERADIHYIVVTLAEKNVVSLGFMTKELEARGERIDHVHPLRFLEYIFTDEHLKAGIHNIKRKGWVWNNFIGGLKESMTTETTNNNMTEDYLFDFAHNLGVDYLLLQDAYFERDWDCFIHLLITYVPRQGDFNRYDCRRGC